MIKETVQVVKVSKDRVKVKFLRKQACNCCSSSHICSIDSRGEAVIDKGDFSLSVGDKAEVGIEEKRSLLAGLIGFFLPAVIFVSMIFSLKEVNEALSFFIAILAICIYYLFVRYVVGDRNEYFELKLLKKL